MRTTGGLSNVSFGLPNRPLLNRTFVAMCAGLGIDGAVARRAQQADDGHHQVHRGAARRGQLLRRVPQGSPRRHPGVDSDPCRSAAACATSASPSAGCRPDRSTRSPTCPACASVTAPSRGAGPSCRTAAGPPARASPPIFPHGGDLWHERVVAGAHAANGVGELIGISAVREWGLIETPILLTNSQSVGAVYDATVRWMMDARAAGRRRGRRHAGRRRVRRRVPQRPARHARAARSTSRAALDAAAAGPVAEGCVGAGTGMTCFDFKAGIGTSSRVVAAHGRGWTVGVLALTNFGVRHRLSVDGVPVGREITDLMPLENREGSCIVVLATDAPLSARQCERLARRCALGLAVTGSYASDGSGEIMLAFTTAHRVPRAGAEPAGAHLGLQRPHVRALRGARSTPPRRASATRSRAATTTVGRDGNTALRAAAGPPGRRPAASRARGAAARGVAPPCRARRGVYDDPLARPPRCRGPPGRQGVAHGETPVIAGRSSPSRPPIAAAADGTACPRRLTSRGPVRGRPPQWQHSSAQGSGNHGCKKEARVRRRSGPSAERPAGQWTNDATSCARC